MKEIPMAVLSGDNRRCMKEIDRWTPTIEGRKGLVEMGQANCLLVNLFLKGPLKLELYSFIAEAGDNIIGVVSTGSIYCCTGNPKTHHHTRVGKIHPPAVFSQDYHQTAKNNLNK